MVASQDVCPNSLALESPALAHVRLNRIDPDRFPIQTFNNHVPSAQDTPTTRLFEHARTGMTVRLAPQVLFQDDKIIPFVDPTEALKTLGRETINLADTARARIMDLGFLQNLGGSESDIPNRDAEIIALGTGSALPSKYRNVSATLVRVPGHGSYLFDCGENTLGSLRRLYGIEGANGVLADLRVIWLSHLHADHHLGTASMIRAWRDATVAAAEDGGTETARLAVASHINMLDWLREYADVEDYGYDRLRLVELQPPNLGAVCEPFIFGDEEAKEFGMTRIDATLVEHCHGAMATVFSWPTGLKVAYSGDCRPSDEFVKIGQGATLLIHESTFDDELGGEAIAKKHCTMAEALDVARRMRARRVLLTHFSQRYPKFPVFNIEDHGGGPKGDDEPVDHASPRAATTPLGTSNPTAAADSGGSNATAGPIDTIDMVVLMAFDHMCVKLGDFKKAAAFLPALHKLFEHEEQ